MSNEVVRVGNGKGADGEVEELEALGGEPSLEVSGFVGVEWHDAVPRSRRGRARLLHRYGDEVGGRDVGLNLLQ